MFENLLVDSSGSISKFWSEDSFVSTFDSDTAWYRFWSRFQTKDRSRSMSIKNLYDEATDIITYERAKSLYRAFVSDGKDWEVDI